MLGESQWGRHSIIDRIQMPVIIDVTDAIYESRTVLVDLFEKPGGGEN